MCLCILYFQAAEEPVLMAANREERYARKADSPRWLPGTPGVYGGCDRQAGGTWQGVNEYGLLVALTNRGRDPGDPQRRSRGLLCLDALRQRDARACAGWLREHLAETQYNACNLLCVDALDAYAVHHDGAGTAEVQLRPGLHLLTDTDADDMGHPRIQRARTQLAGADALPLPELRRALFRVMADHACDATEAICRHGELGGTVSSSVISLTGTGLGRAEFWFAPGPPCRSRYENLSDALGHRPAR